MIGPLQAQEITLPAPGQMLETSVPYRPAMVKGITVHPSQPFQFDFLIDSGETGLKGQELKDESLKLIKYFLAALAVPEDELWVNLSPYEEDRMIPEVLGQTQLGKDLLAEDYILKQLTASLIYPEKQLGKDFWNKVYTKTKELYGNNAPIPVNTFNKVWILADTAKIFEKDNTAFVVSSHLKVMLEEDYLATKKNKKTQNLEATNVVREVILPEIEKEINTGKNFASLRQIFHAFILASWYKKNLKQALLTQVYADKAKVDGINLKDPSAKEAIYKRYLEAYKKGVFNYIKEDMDPMTQQPVARKYFSGGARFTSEHIEDTAQLADLSPGQRAQLNTVDYAVTTDIRPKTDAAMAADEEAQIKEAKQRLSEIITKPVDYDWVAHAGELPDLTGQTIGYTNVNGAIGFSPFSQFVFYWKALGRAEKDWKAVVVDWNVNNGVYAMTVELTKKNEKPVRRTFQIGRFTRTMEGRGKEQGNARQVLDIDDRLALHGIKELLLKPSDYDWVAHAQELPDLKGLTIGITNVKGSIGFTPEENFLFDWILLGRAEKGWKAVVADAGVKNGIYEITVEFTKEGEDPFQRTFQIGRFTRTLAGVNSQKGNTKKVLDIDDRLGLQGITTLILRSADYNWQANANRLPDLTGMVIGTTDTGGSINFIPVENYAFSWQALGSQEAGWKAVVAESGVKNGIYELAVEFTKEGEEPRRRIFQIGRLTRTLAGINRERGKAKEVLDIDDSLAAKGIAELIMKPANFDWRANASQLPDITGMAIGTTVANGIIHLRVAKNYQLLWPILGFLESGWRAVVVKAGVKNGAYKFTVELTKEGRSVERRVFRIGPSIKVLQGLKTEEGQTMEVLEIVPLKKITSRLRDRQVQRIINLVAMASQVSSETNVPFNREMEEYRRQRVSFMADRSGEILLWANGQRISFKGLEPRSSYKVIPIWEEGLGLFIYFESRDGKTFAYDTRFIERGSTASKKVFDHPVAGDDLGEARLAVTNSEFIWNFKRDPFTGGEDAGPFNAPAQLGVIDRDNVPPWFVLERAEQRRHLREIYEKGYELLSPKTKRYLASFPDLPMDPQIFAEVRAFLRGADAHQQSLQIAGKTIDIRDEHERVTVKSVLLDWTLWRLAGLDPNDGAGEKLSAYYLSGRALGIKSTGKNPIFSNTSEFDEAKFLSILGEDPAVREAYDKLLQAAWRWMFYDHLYRNDLPADTGGLGDADEYGEIFPYFHAMEIGKGQDRNGIKGFYLARSVANGLREFMPWKLAGDTNTSNGYPARKVDGFLQLFNGKEEKRLTQWHIDRVYDALSNAKAQGLGKQADAIWEELRRILNHKHLLKIDAAMTALDQAPGGIALDPSQMRLQVEHSGGKTEVRIDPAMIKQLQDAAGFFPVIINIRPVDAAQLSILE